VGAVILCGASSPRGRSKLCPRAGAEWVDFFLVVDTNQCMTTSNSPRSHSWYSCMTEAKLKPYR